ncbi:MAG: isoprenyl transferase [Deltaproteobacteria bacterium]|nr:isoprenyl transferase [Candidatus Anaeroferrophillus wilburensis]MBN2889332.1 isoprenyl transferase [Deltaproteobacteria bacterium]
MDTLDPERQPRHVAIIMDGNGRWAKKRLLPRIKGHEAGIKAVERTVECCAEHRIEALTLYAFSSENWQRPALEVQALMKLLQRFLRRELPRLLKNNIRLRTIGRTDRLSQGVQDDLQSAIARTSSCTGMTLTLALSYGSRDEIIVAVQRCLQAVEEQKITLANLDPATFAGFLDTAGLPDPDLMLRTGGEYRLSNFLLWQAAYAELYFSETLWPDFSEEELLSIMRDFQQRERRFGMISEQLSS